MASYLPKKENDSEGCKIGIRREENKGRIRRYEPMIRRDAFFSGTDSSTANCIVYMFCTHYVSCDYREYFPVTVYDAPHIHA